MAELFSTKNIRPELFQNVTSTFQTSMQAFVTGISVYEQQYITRHFYIKCHICTRAHFTRDMDNLIFQSNRTVGLYLWHRRKYVLSRSFGSFPHWNIYIETVLRSAWLTIPIPRAYFSSSTLMIFLPPPLRPLSLPPPPLFPVRVRDLQK